MLHLVVGGILVPIDVFLVADFMVQELVSCRSERNQQSGQVYGKRPC